MVSSLHRGFVTALRYLLGGLFLYAGLTKLLEGDLFYNSLYNAPLIPQHEGLISILAWGIPLFEFFIALFLFCSKYLKTALSVVTGVLAVYTVYIIYVLWFAPYVPCSCFGIIKGATWLQHLIFTTFFLLVSCYAVYLNSTLKKI